MSDKEPTALDRAAASVGLFDWERATRLLGGGSYAENTALAALRELAKEIEHSAFKAAVREKHGLDFVSANDMFPVVSGSAHTKGGAVYELANGSLYQLTLEECRALPEGYPKWSFKDD